MPLGSDTQRQLNMETKEREQKVAPLPSLSPLNAGTENLACERWKRSMGISPVSKNGQDAKAPVRARWWCGVPQKDKERESLTYCSPMHKHSICMVQKANRLHMPTPSQLNRAAKRGAIPSCTLSLVQTQSNGAAQCHPDMI